MNTCKTIRTVPSQSKGLLNVSDDYSDFSIGLNVMGERMPSGIYSLHLLTALQCFSNCTAVSHRSSEFPEPSLKENTWARQRG